MMWLMWHLVIPVAVTVIACAFVLVSLDLLSQYRRNKKSDEDRKWHLDRFHEEQERLAAQDRLDRCCTGYEETLRAEEIMRELEGR
jgi:hypothetical protein